jgi:uncharacterized Rmd1/YagE family protein
MKKTRDHSRIKDKVHYEESAMESAMESGTDTNETQNVNKFKHFSNFYQLGSRSLPNLLKGDQYGSVPQTDDLYTDDEQVQEVHPFSVDDFADGDVNRGAKSLLTGRQRKKLATRTKNSEFRANRKKKRVYFCCISSEIETSAMLDEMTAGVEIFGKWKYRQYADVLYLYKEETDPNAPSASIAITDPGQGNNCASASSAAGDDLGATLGTIPVRPGVVSSYDGGKGYLSTSASGAGVITSQIDDPYENRKIRNRAYSAMSDDGGGYASYTEEAGGGGRIKETSIRISSPGAQEIFIFDFGAVVFWGVPRGDEAQLLKTIRKYGTKGLVGPDEFKNGEDDMAFVTSPEATTVTILNDVIELPENSEAKQRLSVSFAIAQSSVLAIFESRIEKKVEEYKYIPEALAAHGKIHLTELQLGIMIGEVFVIRHDVNLHTEILG